MQSVEHKCQIDHCTNQGSLIKVPGMDVYIFWCPMCWVATTRDPKFIELVKQARRAGHFKDPDLLDSLEDDMRRLLDSYEISPEPISSETQYSVRTFDGGISVRIKEADPGELYPRAIVFKDNKFVVSFETRSAVHSNDIDKLKSEAEEFARWLASYEPKPGWNYWDIRKAWYYEYSDATKLYIEDDGTSSVGGTFHLGRLISVHHADPTKGDDAVPSLKGRLHAHAYIVESARSTGR